MKGVTLKIAYDGTEFHGWQLQPGMRCVQSTIQETMNTLGHPHSSLRVTSRTDAGVHARHQIASFDAEGPLPPFGWQSLLNKALPNDVCILDAWECEVGYNPRFDSMKKRYRYWLRAAKNRDPLSRNRMWRLGSSMGRDGVYPREDKIADYIIVDKMKEAAALLTGTHDFAAFRSSQDLRVSTVRTMHAFDFIDGLDEGALAIDVTGNSFMKNMVRILIGTLVEVGRGRFTPEHMLRLLSHGERGEGGPTAPAHGLSLEWIEFGRIALLEKEGDPYLRKKASKSSQTGPS